ncbi:MAG: hypothetical protein JOZ69_06250, partial [Myxococcales bacterium]|nr:hypothetical protein [Myxococcales bacterium]
AGDGGADAHPDGTTDAPPDVVADVVESGPVDAGCKQASDCPRPNPAHQEVACDFGTRNCVQLTTDECPYVIGDYDNANAPPVYVGAFATLPPSGGMSHPSYQNYNLAINEFGAQGGIPGWNAAKQQIGLRMPVAVVCNVEANVDTAMGHLVGDVGTPAVVSSLDSVSLRSMFLNDALPNNVFVVNAFGANSTLTSIATKGLLWHMLGQPSDDAPAYQAFFPRVEAYVRTLQNIPAGTPIKVATVTANATDTQDLASAVSQVLTWNGGKTVTQNAQANPPAYVDVTIESVLSGKDLNTQIDLTDAIKTLAAFKPNIIVSYASSEFVKLLQTYELSSPPPNPPPFYLVSPYNSGSQTLKTWIGNMSGAGSASELRRTRVAGVNVASASDTHVLDAYQTRFLATYMSSVGLGYENYYDAMYFAIYATLGAGALPTITGTNLGQGMLRLLSGNSYDMGPADIGAISGALNAPNGTISLFGALGPPSFTISTGARIGAGSVYCLQRNSDLTTSYVYDVLRVVPSTDGGPPGLGGTFTCYSGI